MMAVLIAAAAADVDAAAAVDAFAVVQGWYS